MMHEGPAWQRHAGPPCLPFGGLAHRLPLHLGRDLLPAVIDLRRLLEILEVGLQPLLPDLLDALRAKILLLGLERCAVRRLARIDAQYVNGIALANRDADASYGQGERCAECLADRAEGTHGTGARDEARLLDLQVLR